MSNARYRIYPSLLDKFQSFLDAEQAVEESSNLDDDGEYIETADEMSDRLERELLDAINRVPKKPIEAIDKGTCFNEVIDCLIARRKCEYDGMEIQSGDLDGNRVITAKLNGFEFMFDRDMCLDFAGTYFADATCNNAAISQHLCSAILPTKYGDVELYGYVDEIKGDLVIDIKTTRRYDFGKFGKGWQRHLYPYCLIASGEMASIRAFCYDVVLWSGGTKTNPITKGKFYREWYDFHYDQSQKALTMITERFIEWLEAHRAQITDKKIFAEE